MSSSLCFLRRGALVPRRAPSRIPRRPQLLVPRSNVNSHDEVAKPSPQVPEPSSQEDPQEVPEFSPEDLEEAEENAEVQSYMRVVLLNGLNFLIVFVAAFMGPSLLPREIQGSLGLTSMSTISVLALVIAAAVSFAFSVSATSPEQGEVSSSDKQE